MSISRTTWRWPLSSDENVAVPYVENTLYSTNKYRCIRRVLTLYISYFTEHNVDDEPYEDSESWNRKH